MVRLGLVGLILLAAIGCGKQKAKDVSEAVTKVKTTKGYCINARGFSINVDTVNIQNWIVPYNITEYPMTLRDNPPLWQIGPEDTFYITGLPVKNTSAQAGRYQRKLDEIKKISENTQIK